MRSYAWKSILLGVLIVGVLGACEKLTPVETDGTVSVRVVDALSGAALSGVVIEACPAGGSCSVPTVSVQTDGSYQFKLVGGSGYTINFARAGYLTAVYRNVIVEPRQTTFLQQILLIDDALDADAPASGIITDAFSGAGVAGATIGLRSGINTVAGTVVAQTTTGADGAFLFSSLPAGYYTAEVTASGYIVGYFTVIVVGGQANANQNYGIAPIGASGVVRIVLTWGIAPRDLDAHLTGPAVGGGRFHVYFGTTSYGSGGTTYVELDLDDTNSYGPETITINEQVGGLYRYSVHDFTNRSSSSSNALAYSGAQVRVFRGAALERTFNVPPGDGTLWTVFEMTGNVITAVNSMTFQEFASNVTSLSSEAKPGH